MYRFNDSHYYATVGLCQPLSEDEHLGMKISWELQPIQKECILRDAFKRGSKEQLIEDAAEFFGEEPIFYKDEEGNLTKTFFHERQ